MTTMIGHCLLQQSRFLLTSSVPKAVVSVTAFRFFSSTRGHGSLAPQVFQILQAQEEVPLSKRFSGVCTSVEEDLTLKKCVPCNSKDIRPMTEESAHELLTQVDEWSIASEDGTLKLHRSWKVKSFTKGLEFFQRVADVAEAEGHHPDLHLVGWNNVKIDIWTHSVGGLTENDFILAAKINSLDLEGLLRRKGTTSKE